MIWTVLRIMWLGLLRDRGALTMAFVLPPLMFLVFAEVFSGAGDEDLTLRVALLDTSGDPTAVRFETALFDMDGIERPARAAATTAELEAVVREGRADAAIWIRARPGSSVAEAAALQLIGDGSKALALAILSGRVQAMLQRDFPELELQRSAALVESLAGPFSPAQQAALGQALQTLSDPLTNPDRIGSPPFEQRLLGGSRAMDPGVSYYAAAVAILFLMFAAMQGAISLIDERSSGIVDRLVAGPGGIGVVVLGKGLFLTVQGVLQAALIFAVAWLVYGLDWPRQLLPWLLTAVLAASVAAWLGLLLASLCQSRQQAQTASAFVVLILAAIGGSMVPRFLMPGWLRDLGWVTPNAWVIESWHGMMWREASFAELSRGWIVLAAFGLLAALFAVHLSIRGARTK